MFLQAMTAATRSPCTSSGAPMTAHSATSGCARMASSTCGAEILYPPLFMMSTLARPTMRQYGGSPSSEAMSPVLHKSAAESGHYHLLEGQPCGPGT